MVKGKRGYTRRLEHYILSLSKVMTIKDIARHLRMSWDVIKDIQKRHLRRNYSKPSLAGVRYIGIDEFSVRKGHRYMTIVVDLLSGRVLHIGQGRSGDALHNFWERVRKEGVKIEAVTTDMSPAFIGSVIDNAPDSALVLDHFHVVKLMNTALDELRRSVYREEKELNKRDVVKGLRWVLLRNSEDVSKDKKASRRLKEALDMNAQLAQAYYLKEELRTIWMQASKKQAEKILLDWVEKARSTTIRVLNKMANTLLAHRAAILAWYDYRISTGKLEGINNKIKTFKRKAYGYRDIEFFKLSILAIHTKTYEFIG